jgi:membrane associated rhomboid family serine protease
MSFENAAVTKGLMIFIALMTISAGIFDIKHYFHLQFVPHISRHHQYWRLISHQLAFSNSTDFFLAGLLCYNVGRHIERQFGSVKYASFVFVSLLLATLLQFVAVILFHRIGVNNIALGPMAILFSILYQYSRIVPPVYLYRIFGVSFNNKSTNYILALQLAISRPLSSVAVALIGIVTGKLYRSDLAGFNAYRLPPSVIQFSKTVFFPLIGSLHPPRRTNRAAPDTFWNLQNDEIITTAPTTRGRDRANVGLRIPSQEEIALLTTMFPSMEREAVVGALQRSPNIGAAVETLLTPPAE